MRLRNVKNKEDIMNNSNYLVKNYYDFKGNWKELFGNDNPIYIEIGMGKGKFIIENAKMYPDINFIGIEKYDSVIAKGLQKIPDGLNNLFMIRADALDIDEIFFREIDRVYLNFSELSLNSDKILLHNSFTIFGKCSNKVTIISNKNLKSLSINCVKVYLHSLESTFVFISI